MTLLAFQDSGETLLETGLTLADWVWAGGLALGAIVASIVVRRTVGRVLSGKMADFAARLIARVAAATVLIFGLIYALEQLGVAIGPLVGALGVAGVAIAFALQDILENLLSGVLLLVRRPFVVGDQVTSNEYDGTVDDVNLRTTVLKTFDGQRVYLPNSAVWKNPIVNRTELGSRRTTLALGVSYDTDLDAAQQVMVEAVAAVEGVRQAPEPEAWVHSFGNSSIDFAVRFWHDPSIADEWKVRDGVARSLKRRLDAEGIDIPFPQRVLRFHTTPAFTVEGSVSER